MNLIDCMLRGQTNSFGDLADLSAFLLRLVGIWQTYACFWYGFADCNCHARTCAIIFQLTFSVEPANLHIWNSAIFGMTIDASLVTTFLECGWFDEKVRDLTIRSGS